MQLDSVRSLKADIQSTVLAALDHPPRLRALGVAAGPVAASGDPASPSLALGVVPGRADGYRLAVRIQRRALEGSDTLEAIRRRAHGEIDIRYIGRLVKRAGVPWFQQKARPLRIGCSIGHFKITAGTLGAFVRSRSSLATHILSNNHVLANENRAKKGDLILQPGNFDRGENPADVAGNLATFIRLKRSGANLMDCAAATLAEGVKFDPRELDTLGQLTGVGEGLLKEGEILHKIGRTTGATRGRVTAIEMDNVLIGYDSGTLRFDQQIEIKKVQTTLASVPAVTAAPSLSTPRVSPWHCSSPAVTREGRTAMG